MAYGRSGQSQDVHRCTEGTFPVRTQHSVVSSLYVHTIRAIQFSLGCITLSNEELYGIKVMQYMCARA